MTLKKTNAVTLMELLIATIITGILMAGIVSIDFSLRSSSLGTTRTALVAMRTQAMMLHMSKNISRATGFGDGTNNTDPGILFNAGPPVALSPLTTTGLPVSPVWIRIDLSNPPTPELGNDTWVCYDMDNQRRVRFCRINGCPGACGNCNNPIPANSLEILGTAVDVQVNHRRDPNMGSQAFDVSITIDNLFDPTQAYHMFRNPQYQLSTQVETPLHGY